MPKEYRMFPRLTDSSLKACSISFATAIPLAVNVFPAVLTYLSLASVNHAGHRDSSCLGESWKESSLRKLRPRKWINHPRVSFGNRSALKVSNERVYSHVLAQEASYCAVQILKHRHTFFI